MAEYRVEYSGYCVVEAESEEEARELAQDEEFEYDERTWERPCEL